MPGDGRSCESTHAVHGGGGALHGQQAHGLLAVIFFLSALNQEALVPPPMARAEGNAGKVAIAST